MDLERAKAILKAWVETDRKYRDNKVASDFDEFCETRNKAIETVLKHIDAQ